MLSNEKVTPGQPLLAIDYPLEHYPPATAVCHKSRPVPLLWNCSVRADCFGDMLSQNECIEPLSSVSGNLIPALPGFAMAVSRNNIYNDEKTTGLDHLFLGVGRSACSRHPRCVNEGSMKLWMYYVLVHCFKEQDRTRWKVNSRSSW